MAHATQSTRTFGDVVIEQIDTCVLVVSQVSRGQVGHAGGLLVVIRHHVVHVRVRMRELLECPVIYSKPKDTSQERNWFNINSDRAPHLL